MSGASCDEVRAAAAELALGVLDGEERARVLAHARGCAACRAHLDELAVVAREILTAAPVHEPPPGFESRVLEALAPARPRDARGGLRRRRRVAAWPGRLPPAGTRDGRGGRRPRSRVARSPGRLLPRDARAGRGPVLAALVVAVALAAAGATWATLAATRADRQLGARYRAVLATAGGRYLAAAELRDAAGVKRGVVFAYQGDQPWITVVLAPSAPAEPWRASISTRAGAERALGGFDPARAGPVWGHALPIAVPELAGIHLTGADGRELRALVRRR